MTQGERIKKIRKTFDLTLEKFGNRLGVTKVAISNIENGNRNLTEQMIKSVCREFKINEHWLRTGEGEMIKQRSKNQEISTFADDIMGEMDDSFKKRFVRALSKLEPSDWEVFEKFIKELNDESGDQGIPLDLSNDPETPEELESEYPPVKAEQTDAV